LSILRGGKRFSDGPSTEQETTVSKFTNTPPAKPRGPVRTTERAATHEGGAGWLRDPESELYVLAATNFVSEDSFYESAADRDNRFVQLVHAVAKSNPTWLAGSSDEVERDRGKVGFISYLRNRLNMRSAPIVAAAEYVAAGGPDGRQVIDHAIVRADECAEMLGYWMNVHGRKLPAPVKRGIADAARRLYTERNALKWDGQSKGIRFADVIELVHPRPKNGDQSVLFSYLLDKRHHSDNIRAAVTTLPLISLDRELLALPEAARRDAFRNGRVAEVGWSWERLAGWLPGGMDSEAWMGVIPQMGYMALLRNLRNFDEAQVFAKVKAEVKARLEDPAEVAKSRQFPYRFWSAYKNVPSMEWAASLEKALELSTKNIPELPGRTLVLIDTSGSMQSPVSNRSKVQRYEIGALFAAAVAKKSEKVDVHLFATDTMPFPVVDPSISTLRYIENVQRQIGKVGHGTNLHQAVRQTFAGHDRVVLMTDEAARDSAQITEKAIPMLHVFNLAGYQTATFEAGPGRFTWAGFSDAVFEVMGVVEKGRDAEWPF
jgi:hypothetical protein